MTVLVNGRGDGSPPVAPTVPTTGARGPAFAASSTRTVFLALVSLATLLPSACAFSSGLPRFCATTANGASNVLAATVRRSHQWIRPRAHDSSQQRPSASLLMSYDGGECPSDVGDTVEEAISVVEDNPELRESMKREIVTIAATSNRSVESIFSCYIQTRD